MNHAIYTLLAVLLFYLPKITYAQEITSLVLVNATTNQDIRALQNQDTINLAEVGTMLNIRANTQPLLIGSVWFEYARLGNLETGSGVARAGVNTGTILNTKVNKKSEAADNELLEKNNVFTSHTENTAPYAMAGDLNGKYHPWTPIVGRYTLKATPFSEFNRKGTKGATRIINLVVINQKVEPDNDTLQVQKIARMVLINATTGQDIRALKDQDTINLAQVGTALNIRADTDPLKVGSVLFDYGGLLNTRTENTPPYALAGTTNGKYNSWNPAVGMYALKVTPFSEADRKGTKGITKSINFVVIKDDGVLNPPPNTGTGSVSVAGELKKWHTVTLSFTGPFCREQDNEPNPFLDYRLEVTFTNGNKTYKIPGYFAADGNAANTGATAGSIWRVHFTPDATGTWNYTASFRIGKDAAINDSPTFGTPVAPINGITGAFAIDATNKTGRDFRGKGRLQYVGGHYLQFAETGEFFLKQGADSPENFLSYADFDGDFKNDGEMDHLVKTWAPHVKDWQSNDPVWQKDKGKGMIGAVNYLASEELNAFSFLTFNIEGDDRNVFPYVSYSDYHHFDCSKLDQWEIVFAHAQRKGLYLHIKTQETENETLLDGGNTTRLRKLYYRELIARFSHHLALNWNLGEENGSRDGAPKPGAQTTAQRAAMAQYFYDHDPYRHHIVIHNGQSPTDLLGNKSKLTGFAMQTGARDFSDVHGNIKYWLGQSVQAGKPWVVSCDEPGDASYALVPDKVDADRKDARQNGLWGSLLGGGTGNEWYFGYENEESDLTLQDYRSRDLWWDQCRYALQFFEKFDIPFWEMKNNNNLVGSGNYCFFKNGEVYVILLKQGGTTSISLPAGQFSISWYNPRSGGALQKNALDNVTGGKSISVGSPPNDGNKDWIVLIRQNTATSKTLLPKGSGSAADSNSSNIYPNPAKNQLTIDQLPNGTEQISILSVEGKVEKIISLDDQQTTVILDVSDLATGTYFIQMQGAQGTTTGRFIKK